MTARIISTGKGPVESVNADHVGEWEIENGRAFLVCDGIDHIEKTKATIAEFGHRLLKSDWIGITNPETTLMVNVFAVLDSMSPQYDGRSFCCCIVLVYAEHIIVAHCGDCRVGRITSNGMCWLTEDDVPFLAMFKRGKITEEVYLKCRHLLSCKLKVGGDNRSQLKIQRLEKSVLDRLILCSDGFWSETEHLLDTDDSNILDNVTQALLRLESTAKDNYSVIII